MLDFFSPQALNYETPTPDRTSLSGTEILFPAKKVPLGGFRNSELQEIGGVTKNFFEVCFHLLLFFHCLGNGTIGIIEELLMKC